VALGQTTRATPPLGRPATNPHGFVSTAAAPAAPSSQSRPPGAPPFGAQPPSPSPPAAYGPPQAPPMPMNPFQSQPVFPQTLYPKTNTPPHGIAPPRKRETIPNLHPQLGVVAPVPRVPTGTVPIVAASRAPFPPANAGRIMVQYPQVGTKLPGTRGTYEVRDVIGSGEFGAVYECIGPFDQIYAVKMVRPSNRPYSEVHAEWAKEAARLVSLRHPNVVYIYDSFAHDHLFYLALERCDHPLKVMLGTPLQEGLVLEMSRQLLAAVQFLHDNDVVHDDLHAGNVLITHTDRPTVKISDFGISNELRGMAAVRPNIVHHAIMAPEILATGYTSRQSDLYQVGLLIYWMLTGESAMQLDVPYQELVRQVAEGEPRQRAEQLGTPLGQLVAKMLRRREAFRYSSAREVWAELRELPAWKQRNLFPAK
jgi:serine/threonine-protein kinase